MNAACPQCAHRIVIEDARAPERPFAVRCPKCQATVRFPGRSAAPGAAPAGAPGSAASAEVPPAASPSGAAAAEDTRGLMAELRRELGPDEAGRPRQVLVALPDAGMAGSLTMPLTRLGYSVDTLDRPEEGGRMLEHGAYDVVITTRTAPIPGRAESLYQRVGRLGPEPRRRIFLILVGDEFKTGDGLQAFLALADLVVNPRDASLTDAVLLNTMAERSRIYHAYLDARHRLESAAS